MSKYRGDFKSKGNPKIWIKTPVRTKLKKSSFLVNTVVTAGLTSLLNELMKSSNKFTCLPAAAFAKLQYKTKA